MSTHRFGRVLALVVVLATVGLALSATSTLGFQAHPLLSQITQTTAGSPLTQPWGLTFDSAGDLFVGAAGQGQIDEFDSANAFQGAIGNGALSSQYPRSVAVDRATGDVYVADSQFDAVLVFKSAGGGAYTLLSTWHGTASALGGFGGGYVSVAIDNSPSASDPHAGDVYVLSTQPAIDVFKPKPPGPEEAQEGELVSELSTPGFALPGGSVGAVVDSSTGILYVPDAGNHAVDEFSDTGTFLTALHGPSEPFAPIAVAVQGSTHDVYVVDGANRVVDIFDNTGALTGGIAQPLVDPLGVAVNASGEIYVSDGGSQPPAVDIFGAAVVLLPDVTTGAASEVARTSAKLEGVVDPDGQAVTSCVIEYGPTAAYGQSEPCTPAPGSGSSPVAVSVAPGGLTPASTYHYRVVASNANGPHAGGDKTFTTPPAVEGLLTLPPSEVTGTTATLNGLLEPNGVDTHYHFEYGPSYGQATASSDAGFASEQKQVSASITGLEPNTSYSYRLTAENTFGSTASEPEAFTTEPVAPVIGALTPPSKTRVSATLGWALNPENSPTSYRVLYGTTSQYGEHTETGEINGPESQQLVLGLNGLVPNTTYHYALQAINQAGTVTGPDETLTTGPAAPPAATTGAASEVTLTSATVSGTINPDGLATSYEVDFGSDTGYGTSIYGEAGSGTEPITISVVLQNLAPSTIYHYRIVATNADGTAAGEDQTFTTPVYSNPITLPSTLPLIATPTIAFPTETTGTIITKTTKKHAGHKRKRPRVRHKQRGKHAGGRGGTKRRGRRS